MLVQIDLDRSAADKQPVETLSVCGVSDLQVHDDTRVRLFFPPKARIAELVVAGSISNNISYEAATDGITLGSYIEDSSGVALGVASRRFPAVSRQCQHSQERIAPHSHSPTRIYCLSKQSAADDPPAVSLPESVAAVCNLPGPDSAFNRAPWPPETAYPAPTLDQHHEVTPDHTPTVIGAVSSDPDHAIIESESQSQSVVIPGREFETI